MRMAVLGGVVATAGLVVGLAAPASALTVRHTIRVEAERTAAWHHGRSFSFTENLYQGREGRA